MPDEITKVRVSDGATFIVYAPLAEFKDSFQIALRGWTLLEITTKNGRARYVNPVQIISIETAE